MNMKCPLDVRAKTNVKKKKKHFWLVVAAVGTVEGRDNLRGLTRLHNRCSLRTAIMMAHDAWPYAGLVCPAATGVLGTTASRRGQAD
jgi:hypothetical protein